MEETLKELQVPMEKSIEELEGKLPPPPPSSVSSFWTMLLVLRKKETIWVRNLFKERYYQVLHLGTPADVNSASFKKPFWNLGNLTKSNIFNFLCKTCNSPSASLATSSENQLYILCIYSLEISPQNKKQISVNVAWGVNRARQ